MALVSKSIPNLINGVSQQPSALRLPTQGEAQENGLSDVVDGLKKRPPTKFLNKLVKVSSSWTSGSALTSSNTEAFTSLADCYITTYKRSQTEQYTVVIEPHSTAPVIYVYDINGNLNYQSNKASWKGDGTWCVDNTDSTAYLAGITKEEMTSTSVADATFIVNKSKAVATVTTPNPPSEGEAALVYLKSVNYEREYKVTIEQAQDSAVPTSTPYTITGAQMSASNNISTSSGSNDNALKVGTIIMGLRNKISNDPAFLGLGADTNGDISNGHYYAAVGTTNGTIFGNSQALRLQTTDGIAFPSDYTKVSIVSGGNFIPYAGTTAQAAYDANRFDTTADQGWVYDSWTNTSTSSPYTVTQSNSLKLFIRLPPSALRNVTNLYFNGVVSFERPSVFIYENSIANTQLNFMMQPLTFNSEAFFVITSDPNGFMPKFNIYASDDDGGVNLRVFKDTAKSFTDLPNQCIDGFRIQVAGDNNKKEDNFYVIFDGSGGSGVWKETVGAGIINDFDLTTMPHTLKQKVDSNGNLYFTFTQGQDNDGETWRSRKAGDDNTNPFPSFEGNTINDIFFHRNRLGIISGENVIFSEASNFFNFFRTTVRALLDSDPIDVAVSQNEVSELKAALPIQDSLLLFSELNQFTLSASQLLTPAEVTIDQSTKFECDLRTSPVGAGNSVFFNTVGGNFAGVREYFTDGDTEIKDATLITSHVPAYLSGNVRKMAASTNEDMLICLTSAVKSEAYIYKWYNSNNERLQSSWSKWTFDKNVADVTFNNSDLYITFEDGSFEKMDLTSEAPEISFVVTNDIKADLTPTAAVNTTYTSTGNTYILKGFISQERAVDYSGFSPDISSGFGTINNAAITSCFLFKETNTSVTPNTSIYSLFGTINRTKLGINKIEDYPTSVTLEGTTLTLAATYNQDSLDSLSNSQLLIISATITETQFNALLNNVGTPTDITLNRVSTTFTKKDYPVHLDHQVKLQASTSAAASFTTSDLNTAYTATSVTQFIDHKGDVIATGNSDAAKAKVVAVIHNKEHTENGSTVGSYVYVGEPYTFKYQLSEQVFTPERGDTTDLARFQLRNISFKYNDAGTFNVTTASTGRTPKVSKFTGRIVGQANNLLGYAAVVDNGSYKVGVQSQAKETDITITNDSHLPSTFQSAEYEAWITLRHERL
jgi:hypothetical protein